VEQYFFISFETCFGRMHIVWKKSGTDTVITRVLLPTESECVFGLSSILQAPAGKKNYKEVDAVITQIQRMLLGEAVEFDLRCIDIDTCAPFQKKVLLAEHGIPRGLVSTYGRIANFIGSPGGARAVGNALAKNPFPLIIPCHRAVRTNGSLGGFRGGTEMKRSLLRMEGVEVDRHGRVRPDRLYY
jgi:methylated-DNA-[protein]-cysteine S-methyltransferase